MPLTLDWPNGASRTAFIGALFYRYAALRSILDEHLEANDGQVLAHLLMSDVIRWVVAHLADERETCISILAWLEEAYVDGDEDIQNVIDVSGVEIMPGPHEPGYEVRQLLGSSLSRYYDVIWSQ